MFAVSVFGVNVFQMWFGFQRWNADMSVQIYIVSAQQVPELFFWFLSFSNAPMKLCPACFLCSSRFAPGQDLILCRYVCSKNTVWGEDAPQTTTSEMNVFFYPRYPCLHQLPWTKLMQALGLCLLDNSWSSTGFNSFEVIGTGVQLSLMGLGPWTGAL